MSEPSIALPAVSAHIDDPARTVLFDGRLPIVPSPVVGESLTGFLDRVAVANGQTRRQLYERAGLPMELGLSYELSLSERRALTRVLGLSRTEIAQMTLAGHAAFSDAGLATVRTATGHPLLGLWADSAAQCPACHVEQPGIYPLRTLSGMTFACVKHRLLTIDRCPGCGMAVRLAATWHGCVSGHHVPRPGCCQHSFGRRSCGYPLADLPRIDLTDWPAALEAQRMLDDLFAIPSSARRPQPSSVFVLAALARWLLYPGVCARLRDVPGHLRELIIANWQSRGDRGALLHIGRRSRTCVAVVMSAVAPGYLTADPDRLAASIRALIPDPRAGEQWYEGLPLSDSVVDAAAGLAFTATTSS